MSSENSVCSNHAASSHVYIKNSNKKKSVAVLLGPTAIGKSALAMQLAEDFNCEIVSCDSRQIYKFMNIGTAKVSIEERKRIRHWMIDIIDPDKIYSAFQYANDAADIIQKRTEGGKRLLICGGTGLYYKILSEGGISSIASDPSLRKELMLFAQRNGNRALYAILQKKDPVVASKIHFNDIQRVIRALLVFEQTGKSLSSFSNSNRVTSKINFYVYILTMPRELLYQRINRRVLEMAENGLYEEFLQLRAFGYDKESPGMHTVGYRELFPVEHGRLSMKDAVSNIQRSTRRYAKRQITWFSTKVKGRVITSSESYSTIRSLFKEVIQW